MTKTEQTPEQISEPSVDTTETTTANTTPSEDFVINIDKADIYQGKNLILNQVSFTVKAGELVYIVGKTGSGKSNLLKLLYGDVPAVNGTVQIAGFDLRNIKSKNIQKLRRSLGIVFQDFQLLQDRSVYDNLDFIAKVTDWKNKNARKQRIEEVLALVGLSTKGYKMPHQLSGGEQQRVCIARALMNNPKIILADEPTGNLDPETSFDIFSLFRDITRQGTSVLIATHDYLIINQIPSRVIKIENGKVLE
ncbi:MAG: ATP-binding cassette domain-containing protein [Bacteroidales bacterium]|nr:ATP-binding cassette domain-containing protein [Bacteroidales bacterium]